MPQDAHIPILVTGGTGFAGSHLIEHLLAAGYDSIYSTTFSAVDSKTALLPADHYLSVNLTDAAATQAVFRQVQPKWVFHLASFAYVGKSFEKAKELFANNINLQLNVLEAVRLECPTARVLTIGSAEEYGMVDAHIKTIDESVALHPVNPYAVSKVTQDLLAASYQMSYKLDIVRARPFNHIGIRQTGDFAIPAFARQIVAIERGEQASLNVGSLTAVRDFTSVKDMVEAYVLLMERGVSGEVYNIGSGIGVQMQSIVDMMIAQAKVPITITVDPTRIRPLDSPGLIADNRKIRALGWVPRTPIQTELTQVLEDLRHQ